MQQIRQMCFNMKEMFSCFVLECNYFEIQNNTVTEYILNAKKLVNQPNTSITYNHSILGLKRL